METALQNVNLDVTSGITDGINSVFGQYLAPLLLGSIVISALFAVFYVIGKIREWRVQKAIFELQKDVHELKQRVAVPSAPRADTVSVINRD